MFMNTCLYRLRTEKWDNRPSSTGIVRALFLDFTKTKKQVITQRLSEESPSSTEVLRFALRALRLGSEHITKIFNQA